MLAGKAHCRKRCQQFLVHNTRSLSSFSFNRTPLCLLTRVSHIAIVFSGAHTPTLQVQLGSQTVYQASFTSAMSKFLEITAFGVAQTSNDELKFIGSNGNIIVTMIYCYQITYHCQGSPLSCLLFAWLLVVACASCCVLLLLLVSVVSEPCCVL